MHLPERHDPQLMLPDHANSNPLVLYNRLTVCLHLSHRKWANCLLTYLSSYCRSGLTVCLHISHRTVEVGYLRAYIYLIMYASLLPDLSVVIEDEFELGRVKWNNTEMSKRPITDVTELDDVGISFANVNPCSRSWPRCRSQLHKRNARYRQLTAMKELRLVALLLLHIDPHRNTCPTVDQIVEKFTATSARRLAVHI